MAHIRRDSIQIDINPHAEVRTWKIKTKKAALRSFFSVFIGK
jgi:hypothetical protein